MSAANHRPRKPKGKRWISALSGHLRALEDMEAAMKGMLETSTREVTLGQVEVGQPLRRRVVPSPELCPGRESSKWLPGAPRGDGVNLRGKIELFRRLEDDVRRLPAVMNVE